VAVSAKATDILLVPSKLVPPIVLAVSNAVAVLAFPVTSPVNAPAKASDVTVPSKNAFLNSAEDVPKSTSSSVAGTNAPFVSFI